MFKAVTVWEVLLAAQNRRYVIIGNGAAGTTCAETLRQNDPSCEITLLTNEPHPLYNKVALPRYLKGVVREERVFMRTLDQHAEKNIKLMTEVEVTKVDADGNTVLLHDGTELPYDALLVSSGGTPNKLQCPGSDCDAVLYFQTMDDTRRIIAEATPGRHAVVIGGSFISYELTDGFVERGLHTTWLMRGPHFLRRTLDEEGGEVVDALARDQGVEVIHGDEASEVVPRNGLGGHVISTGGRHLQADLIGVGVGLTLNVGFLEGTDVEVRKGVVTDKHLRTTNKDIYAAGDVAEFFDVMIEGYNIMGTWDNALAQGKTVAINMAGGNETYYEVPTYTSTLFKSNIAVMGVTQESRPDLESVTRADISERQYKKLFFLENRLVGALTIGSPRGRKKMLAMMHSGEPIEGPKEAILDLR